MTQKSNNVNDPTIPSGLSYTTSSGASSRALSPVPVPNARSASPTPVPLVKASSTSSSSSRLARMKLKVAKSRSNASAAAKEEEVREPENIAVVDDAAKTMDAAMPEDDEAVRETVAREEITEEVAKEE